MSTVSPSSEQRRPLGPWLAHVSLAIVALSSLTSPSARQTAGLGCASALDRPHIASTAQPQRDPALLFYLSGAHGTDVDFSKVGTKQPNVVRGISVVEDGARGQGLHCEPSQVLSYWAPGNIYAQRGTLSFFWRSSEPVGPTEFPIFRVAFADHSSWDMVWLRIDYNGHGFDAFVTDANLARIRVSVPLTPFPRPETWIHLALAWDETSGIRFYVNGALAAKQETRALLDTALDQFGPHSRIISPHNVQSDYNFVRGGDIDELSIYDRALDDAAIAALARGELPTAVPATPTVPVPAARTLADDRFRQEWWWRYGWNRPGDPPPYFAAPAISVRKVEIHDAYDHKRWWWKANDGIRETTWPGVYNRSTLPGRHDYFTLPDWDCYSDSGRSVTFTLPDEPWNYLEIEGAAFGKTTLLAASPAANPAQKGSAQSSEKPAETLLFERPSGQERTSHLLARPVVGQKIRFDNTEPEQPIAELTALFVASGTAPSDRRALTYRLAAPRSIPTELAPVVDFIAKRHPPDERSLLIGEPLATRPGSAAMHPSSERPTARAAASAPSLPLVHLLLPPPSLAPAHDLGPNALALPDGLDGIALDLPALDVKPTHGDLFPLDIQVKDPLWPMRNLLEFTFSIRPGEPKTLWLDLRDRILPAGKGLYLSIAAAGDDFGPSSLAGAELRLVFKAANEARKEHEIDRFTQVRDAYAMMVEERPSDPRFNLWNRFQGDLDDLLRVNPDHPLGRMYAAAVSPDAPKPAFVQPEPPKGVPLWAFRQAKALAGVKRVLLWYIENRQLPDGELGGGLSDDTDLTNMWPGAALMGCAPELVKDSLQRVLEACYQNGMLDHGLPVIQTDELHGYEEGINAIAQNLLLQYGSPKMLERAMETARSVATLTGVNAAGHRHFRTAYYSATRVAEDGVWGYSKSYMTLLFHPSYLLVNYNGNPAAKKLVLEFADGLLAHRRLAASGRYELPRAIHFASDRESLESRSYFPWPLFWASYQWSGERKYLDPIFDAGAVAIRAVNADLLDQVGVRDEWRARMLGEEDGDSAAEGGPRPGDVRARHRGNQHRSSSNEHFAWQLTGNKSYLDKLYADAIEEMARTEYINTEGSIWIDRVVVPYADLQRARLGGVALVRNGTFPGHLIGWSFAAPATEASVAILVPLATASAFDVVVYNLETVPVRAAMTPWNVDPGRWKLAQGIDTNDDDQPDRDIASVEVDLERGVPLPLTLPPRATTVLRFRQKTKGAPYESRPDLGIEREDVSVDRAELRVRVHSLGSVSTPAAEIVWRDARGRVRASTTIPPIAAPVDLLPKSVEVALTVPAGVSLSSGSVEIDPGGKIVQITRLNDTVKLSP